MTTMPVFCGRDCGGDACPLLAVVEAGRVIKVRHNPAAGPYLRGCPKGFALPHFHYSPERIKTPLLRSGRRGSGQFKPVSWDEALDFAWRGLSDSRDRFGPQSVLCLSSAGSTGALHNTEKLTRRFLNAIGGCTVPDGSYSSNAASFALKRMFGQDYGDSGFDAATMAKSRLILLWGANILEARLGSELPARLLEASRRGVPVVMIDPRRTRTATMAGAEWISTLPGSDAAFMYALLFVLDSEGLIDWSYIEARAQGFEEIMDHVRGRLDGVAKDPAWAAAACGVEPAAIVSLARRWAATKPTMLLPGYSIQRTRAGEEAARLCVALQLATKNFGLPGGSTGSLNNRLPGCRIKTLDEGDGSGNRHFPVVRWADAILRGGAILHGDAIPTGGASENGGQEDSPPIRAIYSAGGNFLNQGADIAKNVRAFESLDFAICHELFMTPTARYCDLILPAASPLQKEDIGLPWAGNYLLYKSGILPYEGQERSDYEIFRDLASRFGVEEIFTEGRSEKEWIEHFLASSEIADVEAFKKTGIYFGASQERSGCEAFSADPSNSRLGTVSGKVDLGGGMRWTAETHEGEWLLISPKLAERVHSQGGDHSESIGRNTLELNVADALSLGLSEGDWAEIESPNGTTMAEVKPSDDIMRGVACLPEGSWFISPADAAPATGSANHLTSTDGTSESISCIMHGIRVRIRRAKAPHEMEPKAGGLQTGRSSRGSQRPPESSRP